jgi:hypothetical protein
MSESTRTRTYTPPRVLSPEEIQQQRIAAAVTTAMQRSETARQAEIARLKAESNRREANLQQKLAGLDSQIQNTIIQHQQQMKAQSDRFYDDLQAQSQQFEQELLNQAHNTDQKIQSLKEHTDAAINATNAHINAVAQQQQQQINTINGEIAAINNEIVGIHNRFKSEADKKNELLNILKGTIICASNLQHEKYAPGELQKIMNGITNLDGLPDATVCGLAHTAITQLNNLQGEINTAKSIYEIKHTATLAAINKVLTEMNENRKNHSSTENELKDEEGNVITNELDFWSEGEYGELEQKVNELKKKVDEGIDNPQFTIDDLDAVLKIIYEIDVRQKQIVIESIEKGNASQIRAEMADDLVKVLKNQHLYEVVERGYEMEDQRNGYIIKLRNETQKTNLVVLIQPESNVSDNSVTISTISENHVNNDILKQRSDQINQSLADVGIRVEKARCIDEASDALKSLYDDAAILKSKKAGGRAIPEATLQQAGLQRTRRNV